MADRSQSQQERYEERRADRALALLNDAPLFWRFVHALDVIGWKIVRQDGCDMRFPAPIGSKRKAWPKWIWTYEKPKPKLRLIKNDDP